MDGERLCSFDVDFLICCPKDMVRGLLAVGEEGELDSLMLRALEKLHFLDGVFPAGTSLPLASPAE